MCFSFVKGSRQFGTTSLTHFEESKSVALTIHQTTFDDSGLYSCVYNSKIYSSVNISVGGKKVIHSTFLFILHKIFDNNKESSKLVGIVDACSFNLVIIIVIKILM
jgi:hypothetical protein